MKVHILVLLLLVSPESCYMYLLYPEVCTLQIVHTANLVQD